MKNWHFSFVSLHFFNLLPRPSGRGMKIKLKQIRALALYKQSVKRAKALLKTVYKQLTHDLKDVAIDKKCKLFFLYF